MSFLNEVTLAGILPYLDGKSASHLHRALSSHRETKALTKALWTNATFWQNLQKNTPQNRRLSIKTIQGPKDYYKKDSKLPKKSWILAPELLPSHWKKGELLL